MNSPESVPRSLPKRGRPRSPGLTVEGLQGFKFFKRLKGLFEVLRPCAIHPNRVLHYDQYAMGVLFYFYNPAITSLRGIHRASEFEKVQKALGIQRMSMGSLCYSAK